MCVYPAPWRPSSGWWSTLAGLVGRFWQRELGAAEMLEVCVGTVSGTPLDLGQTHTCTGNTVD